MTELFPTDFLGNQIRPGDIIVSAQRASSSAWIALRKVVAVIRKPDAKCWDWKTQTHSMQPVFTLRTGDVDDDKSHKGTISVLRNCVVVTDIYKPLLNEPVGHGG